jgi:hypothetical protein
LRRRDRIDQILDLSGHRADHQGAGPWVGFFASWRMKTGDSVAPGSASRCLMRFDLKGQKLGRDCRVRFEQCDLLHVRWNKQEGMEFQGGSR